MTCDFWKCKYFAECLSHNLYSGAKYPPCGVCVHFDMCDVCVKYIECCDLVVKFLPQMFRRMVRDIRCGFDLCEVERIIRRNTRGGKKS